MQLDNECPELDCVPCSQEQIQDDCNRKAEQKETNEAKQLSQKQRIRGNTQIGASGDLVRPDPYRSNTKIMNHPLSFDPATVLIHPDDKCTDVLAMEYLAPGESVTYGGEGDGRVNQGFFSYISDGASIMQTVETIDTRGVGPWASKG